MSAEKKKGTRAETAVVDYLRKMGFTHAERRTTRGPKDAGDIAGLPGVVIEVKDCQRMELAAWIDEADQEAANDHARIGVVWHKRRGVSTANGWYVTMQGFDFVALLQAYTEAKQ